MVVLSSERIGKRGRGAGLRRTVEGPPVGDDALVHRLVGLVVIGVEERRQVVLRERPRGHHRRAAQIKVADRVLGGVVQQPAVAAGVPRARRRAGRRRREALGEILLRDQRAGCRSERRVEIPAPTDMTAQLFE